MPLPECQVKIAVAHESLPEGGQAAISVVLILGLFLVGILALAVDFTNIWFHRQAAGAAADAACQAGAMDLFETQSPGVPAVNPADESVTPLAVPRRLR